LLPALLYLLGVPARCTLSLSKCAKVYTELAEVGFALQTLFQRSANCEAISEAIIKQQ
jgi:hypothetical protein